LTAADEARVARELLDAQERGASLPPPSARDPGFDEACAWRVAAEQVRLRRARGERCLGRKIGFTNRGIWAEYGATAPIWGHVYDRTLLWARAPRTALSLAGSARPRIEPELAFRLARPLPAGVRDPVAILACVEWVAASFEIVDCHFADWRFRSADSIADFALHWRLLLGEPHALQGHDLARLARQLAECQVTLRRGERVMDRGVGANALGHPALALAHLALLLARQPDFEPLAAGEIVTTGTLTAALPVRAGEVWSSEYAGLPVRGLEIAFGD
jgi:2-oxo-3-hexenedioate decarboxylase